MNLKVPKIFKNKEEKSASGVNANKVDLGRRDFMKFFASSAALAVGTPALLTLVSCNNERIISVSEGTVLTPVFESKKLDRAQAIDEGKDLVLENLNLRLRYLGVEPHPSDASYPAACILVMKSDGSEYDKVWITKDPLYNDDTFNDPLKLDGKNQYKIFLNAVNEAQADVKLMHLILP